MIPNYIIIHHSLTKDSETVSWNAIRKYHKSLGWDDIGYHIGIENLQGNFEGLIGRDIDRVGAHCRDSGRNYDSIGVCFVGNFDYGPPPEKQFLKGVGIVSWLVRQFNIPYDHIKPHSEYNHKKTCPGRMFPMYELVEEIKIRNEMVR